MMSIRSRQVTAGLLLAVTALTLLLAVVGVTGPARVLSVLAFGLIAPGWAVTNFWAPSSVAMAWTCTVAVSVSLLLLLSLTMLLSSAWFPMTVFAVLAVATAATLALHLVRLSRTAAAA